LKEKEKGLFPKSLTGATIQDGGTRERRDWVNVIYGHYCNGIKIEICNTMFDCRFLAPSLSLSLICDVALNVSITLDHYKNMKYVC